jgi:hypothetical protein
MPLAKFVQMLKVAVLLSVVFVAFYIGVSALVWWSSDETIRYYLLDPSIATTDTGAAADYIVEIRTRLDLVLLWLIIISTLWALIWISTGGWVRSLRTPDAVNRRRGPWWVGFALSFVVGGFFGWLLTSNYDALLVTKLSLVDSSVSPVIGGVAGLTAAFAYYTLTMVATPYVLRPAVPAASTLTAWYHHP